ncbi:sodium channel protein Nach-like [Zootermopsis nevadensis]|uniref:sodium channel protein Nach-like n=1 Tax=Zootermopsis nevadensis TaxID=136037 RepID=UPI000B8E2A06|nr:sodium channel protein Nach-like [Zootermopsis nevadensis]
MLRVRSYRSPVVSDYEPDGMSRIRPLARAKCLSSNPYSGDNLAWSGGGDYKNVETNHYPTWRLPFPAVTLCNANRIFRSKAEAVVSKLSLPEHMSSEDALQRLSVLGELIDPNPERISQFSKDEIAELQKIIDDHKYTVRDLMRMLGQSCEELLVRCMWEGSILNCSELFTERKSYDGFCCSFNYRGVVETLTNDGRKTLSVPAQNEVRYTRYYSHRMGLTVLVDPAAHDYFVATMFSVGIRMLVHGSDDFPDDTATEKVLPVGRELLFRVTPTSGYCTEAVRQLDPSARKCVFESEMKLKYFPVYSEINCITECRMDYTIHYCNCSHFYYHNTGAIRLCDLNDLPCLKRYYYRMGSDATPCDCPPLCNNVDYDVQASSGDFKAKEFQITPFFTNITNVTGRTLFHFYFGNHVSIRTRRDVINSWTDLLSSLGGIFSLFLGCSFMSGVEVLYFFTLRLFVRLRRGQMEQPTLKRRHPGAVNMSQHFPHRNAARVIPMSDVTTTRRFL